MALSNWDDWSVDENCNATGGEFKSPIGVVVAIYKNWLYVYDEKAWEENSTFAKPVVMQIDEGELRYKDLRIIAVRCPQNGIFAAVWSGYDVSVKGMIGCGVYGFANREWVGVEQETFEWIKAKIKELDVPDAFKSIAIK